MTNTHSSPKPPTRHTRYPGDRRELTHGRNLPLPEHAERSFVAAPAVHVAADRPAWKGARPETFLRVLAAHPEFDPAVRCLGNAVGDALRPRTLEVAALRSSAVLANLYAWCGHTHSAIDTVLSRREIAAIASGPTALVGRDAAVARAVDELLSNARLPRSTYFALADEAFGLIIAVGFYRLVATIMQDVDPEPSVAVIAGLETPAAALLTYAALSR